MGVRSVLSVLVCLVAAGTLAGNVEENSLVQSTVVPQAESHKGSVLVVGPK